LAPSIRTLQYLQHCLRAAPAARESFTETSEWSANDAQDFECGSERFIKYF
jgi:hypothetical protein